MVTTNPFASWKDEQQCFGAFARDAKGDGTTLNDESAVTFCAAGWLQHKNVPFSAERAFRKWVRQHQAGGLLYLNDGLLKPPSYFKALWDRFEASWGSE